jgi:multiple sugar transport system substrate-binding protein
VQEATEVVITGAKSPEQAAADYVAAVVEIVGVDKTVRK